MPESVVIRPLDKTKTIIRSQDLKPIKYNSTEKNYCIILSADPEIQKGNRAEFIQGTIFRWAKTVCLYAKRLEIHCTIFPF